MCVYKSLRSVVKYFVIGLDTRRKDEKPKIQNLSRFSDSSFLVNCDSSEFLNSRGTEFVTFTSFLSERTIVRKNSAKCKRKDSGYGNGYPNFELSKRMRKMFLFYFIFQTK